MKQFDTLIDDWHCIEVDMVDSTNAMAKRMLQNGPISSKTVIVAHEQSNGYGRSDHGWESGNDLGLWVSAIINVNVGIEELAQSTLVLAVSVQNAVKQATGVDLQIKWPNDLLGDEKKCAGLLVEMAPTASDMGRYTTSHTLVLGVGLNVNQTAGDFSPALNGKATSLSMLGCGEVSQSDLLHCMLESIDVFFLQWQQTGFAGIRKLWLEHAHTLGKTVSFQSDDGYQSGLAIGMSEAGALQVRLADGSVVEVDSGEIFLKLELADT